MIRAVTVTNALGETIRCELENPYANGLNIRNIQGIGPEGVNIATNDLAMIDGSVFSSQRAPQRNIVFDIGFLSVPEDPETARHLTYKYLSIGTLVRLTFETDERNLYIDGYVESNSPSIFEEEEYSQISVICPDPWFRSTAVVVNKMSYDLVDTETGFMFDTPYPRGVATFEELITDRINRYDNSYRSTIDVLNNPGDRPTGVCLRFTCLEDGVEFGKGYLTYDLNESEQLGDFTRRDSVVLQLSENITLNKGDMLVYSTSPGKRMFYALKSGATSVDSPDVFTFPIGIDDYQAGAPWRNPGDSYDRQAPYRSQYTTMVPVTEDGWTISVTQTRGLANSPSTGGYRYDAERTYTEDAPIASTDTYNNKHTYGNNSWTTQYQRAKTFKNSITHYDYIVTDPFNRYIFSIDDVYLKAYRDDKPFSYSTMMNALSTNIGGVTDLWFSANRGVTEFMYDLRRYDPNPPLQWIAPGTFNVTSKFSCEYDLVPLYEGV